MACRDHPLATCCAPAHAALLLQLARLPGLRHCLLLLMWRHMQRALLLAQARCCQEEHSALGAVAHPQEAEIVLREQLHRLQVHFLLACHTTASPLHLTTTHKVWVQRQGNLIACAPSQRRAHGSPAPGSAAKRARQAAAQLVLAAGSLHQSPPRGSVSLFLFMHAPGDAAYTTAHHLQLHCRRSLAGSGAPAMTQLFKPTPCAEQNKKDEF